MDLDYKKSGVNLDAADTAVMGITQLAQKTFNRNVLKDIGLFAGFYTLDLNQYHQPIIVSSIDGVGTKLKVAFAAKKHDTIGQDLVNHCVNDIMTCGADPLFFLDYIGTVDLDPGIIVELVSGMSRACIANNCALIGGETAEMPGFYHPGEYDLVGSIIGAVNRDDIIDGTRIKSGDILLGLRSNGFHTNGYSLVRKIFFDLAQIQIDAYIPELETSWCEILLRTHKSYKKEIETVRKLPELVGISHITGGGIEGNSKRLLQPGLRLEIDWHSWEWPIEFKLIQKLGQLTDLEMERVFNLGIGLVFVVLPSGVDSLKAKLERIDTNVFEIGSVRLSN